MRTGRSTRTGTRNTTKNQDASPPPHRCRTKIAWRAAVCLLVWLGSTGVGFAQTVVWSENFDDGNGNNRWYADLGVWQIGSPTIGPARNSAGCRAHSCPNCATTGLTANYPAGANSRLIRIQSFAVPAANQYPRLRFWQWYNFADAGDPDYGVVEVRAGTNAWRAVSPQYTDSGGDWTYSSVDLSAFAGQTVQLAFHLVYQNWNSLTAPGWYVDDISLKTGTPVFNNPEGWENGIGDWYAETGTWQVGKPTKAGGPAINSFGSQAHSGTNCAVTILNANYPVNANSRLISPPFLVPPAGSSPYMRFWQWYNFADAGNPDYGVVEVRAGTNAWQAVSPQYTDNSANWTEPFIDLTGFGGQTVQVAFHIVYQNWNSLTAPGWYVDDITAGSSGCPVIITQPGSLTNAVGTTATLNVSASGNLPLSYQWRLNSNAIAGATNASFTLTNLQLANSGSYDVVVTNLSCSTTSTLALLQVVISFTGIDIGTPGAPGSLGVTNGVYTVRGSGEDIEGTADDCFFAYMPMQGDGMIVARLAGMQPDNAQSEAGVMMRDGLDSGTRHVFLGLDASANMFLRRRLVANAISIENTWPGTNAYWLRLTRMGNTFIGHVSTNGTNWSYALATALVLPSQLEVGLAVTAHHHGYISTAQFDNLTIGTPTPLSGAWPGTVPRMYVCLDAGTQAAMQNLGGFPVLVGGVVGDQYSIKYSTNTAASLASWQSLGSVTNTWGVATFLDSQALTNRMRFYRAQRTGP